MHAVGKAVAELMSSRAKRFPGHIAVWVWSPNFGGKAKTASKAG